MRPLSYSQINTYLDCPLAYKLQYIDKLPRKGRFYLSFGDVIHQCAEYFYKVPVPPPPSLEKLFQFYEENWISEGYDSPEQEQQYKEYGKKLLEDFWNSHAPAFRMPLAVEHLFNVNIASGITLSGKIDRIDKLEDGLSIVDYKTSKEVFTSDYLEHDLQLTFYQLAAEALWKMPVKKLTLYHLRSNTPCTCNGRKKDKLSEARNIILNVAEGISSGVFTAKENQWCDYCDFPEHCPYRKHQFIQPGTESPESRKFLDGKAANEVVEEYAALQEQRKELEDRLETLKLSLCEYCEAKQYYRLFGSEHTLGYKMVERTGFSEEKVRPLLEPTGLWSRVLKFDPALVKTLLEADYLNPDLRKKLAALKEVISSYPQLTVRKLNEE